MTPTQEPDVIDAGEAEDVDGMFAIGAFPEGSHPVEKELWCRVNKCAERAVLLGENSDLPYETRVGQAESLLYELQALHAILKRYTADTAPIHRIFRALRDTFDRLLPEDKRCADLSQIHDSEHLQAVRAQARRVRNEMLEADHVLTTKLAPEPRTPRRLHEGRRGFQEIRYGNGRRSVYMETSFARRMIREWDTPLLTTTAHAVETLHMIERSRWAIEHPEHSDRPQAPGFRVQPEVLRFAENCYQSGRFRDPDGFEDLYATSSAVAIFKADRDLGYRQRASAKVLEQLFPARISVSAIREHVMGRLEELLALTPQSMADDPAGLNAIVEVNHAMRIYWNLSGDADEATLFQDLRARIGSFLKACVFTDDGHTALSIAPGTGETCLTACLAGTRIAQYGGLLGQPHAPPDKSTELGAILYGCSDFVRRCKADDGGFGSTAGDPPDVLHTYMGVALSKHWGWDLLDDVAEQGIETFCQRCYKCGGYALLPEWKPSAYGTRLAFQTLERLKRPLLHLAPMNRFVHGLLRKHEEGETAGYAGHPDDLSVDGI